jgi:predicted alpha/beta superfamily hydrolase
MLFFEKELLPFLESKYNISAKILWGQGLSGTFSSFVMLTKPGLFDGYISNMPSLNLMDTTFKFDESIININQKDVFYFLTGNTLVESDKMTKKFIRSLEGNKNPHLKWHYKEQNDSIYIAQILNSYVYGLEKFFRK